MVDIKEALAALDELKTLPELRLDEGSDYMTLLRFVQSVAQEREDWRAIEAWLGDDDERDCHIGPSAVGPKGSWTCRLMDMNFHGSRFNADECPTRAEAVSNAATWCRAEMVK